MAAKGASEVGHAYVTIMPSMSKFNKAVREGVQDSFKNINLEKAVDELAKSGKKAGKKAGKAAGEELKSEAKQKAESAGKEAGEEFAEEFSSQMKTKVKSVFNNFVGNTNAKKEAKSAGAEVGNEFAESLNRIINADIIRNQSVARYVNRLQDEYEESLSKENGSGINKFLQQTYGRITGTVSEEIKKVGETVKSEFENITKNVFDSQEKARLKKRVADAIKVATDQPEIRQKAEKLGIDFTAGFQEGQLEQLENLISDFKKELADKAAEASRKAADDSGTEFGKTFMKNLTSVQSTNLNREMKTYITAALTNPEIMRSVEEAGIQFNEEFIKGMKPEDYSKLKEIVDDYAAELETQAKKAAEEAAKSAGTSFGNKFTRVMRQVEESQLRKEMRDCLTTVMSNPELTSRAEQAGISLQEAFTRHMVPEDFSHLQSIVKNYEDELADLAEKAAENTAEVFAEEFRKEIISHEKSKVTKAVRDLVNACDNPEVQARAKSAGIKVGKDLANASADQIQVLKQIVEDVGKEAKVRAMAAASEAAWRASDTFKQNLQKAFNQGAFREGAFKELQAQFGGINFAEIQPKSFDSLKTMGRKFSNSLWTGIHEEGKGWGESISGALTSALSNSPISLSGLSKVKEFFEKVWQYASAVIEEITSKLKEIGTTIGTTLFQSIGTAYTTVANTVKEIGVRAASAFYEAMKNGYTQVINMVTELSTRAATMMYEAIREAYTKVAEVVKDVGQTQLTNAAKSLGIDLSNGIDEGLTSVDLAFGNVLGDLVSNAVSTLNSDLSGAIERFDTMENFPRIMANMGVEASESTANITKLADAIDGLPTALNDITTFTEKVFPMFDKNLGDATTFAIAFNNALVADGKTASQQANAMEQMSQMLGNSKVDMLSWRSVVEAMPTSMNQLAEYFGAGSPQELYNMLPGSQGAADNGVQVTLEELTQAFVKLNEEGLNGYTAYAERAKTATFGIGTAITNLHNRIERAIQAVMEFIGQEKIANFINNITKKFVPSVTQAVGLIDRLGVKDKIASITDTLENGLDTVIEKLNPITEKLEPFLSGALNVATETLNKTITHTIDRAGPFINLVADKMQQFIDNAGEISNLIQPVIDAFIDLKFTTFESALSMWEKVVNAVAPVLPSMLNSVSRITSTVATFIGNISGVVAPIANDIFSALADGISNVEPMVESIITRLAPIVASMAAQIIDIATTIVGAVDEVLKLTNDDGVPYLQNIVNNIGEAVTSIVAAVSPWVGTLLSTISTMSDVLLPIIQRLSDELAPIAMELIQNISETVINIAPRIENIITSLAPIISLMVQQVTTVATTLASIVSSVLSMTNEDGVPLIAHLIETIGNTINGVMVALAPQIPSLVESVVQIVDALSPLITNLATTLAPIATNIISTLADMVTTLSPFIDRIITALAPVIQIMVEQLARVAEIVASALADTLEMTGEDGVPLIQHVVQVIGDTVADIIELLAPHLPHILEAISKIVDALAPAIEEIFKLMEPYIDDLVDLVVYAAQQFAPEIVKIFRDYIVPEMPEIKAAIKDLIDFAVTHLDSMVKQVIIIIEKFEPLWTNVQRIKDDWLPAILRVGGEIADVLINPFADMFEKFSKWLEDLPKLNLEDIFKVSDVSSIKPFANGGIVTQPTRALIGEAGVPEAVVPLSAAGIEKFTSGLDKRYKNGGAPSVEVNIGTFVNNDTSTDVNSLCDQIGRTSLRKLREQGVAA